MICQWQASGIRPQASGPRAGRGQRAQAVGRVLWTRRGVLAIFALVTFATPLGVVPIGGLLHLEAAGQPHATSTSELVRLSDFVGFIRAGSGSVDPGGLWKHRISVTSVEPLKGDLGRGTGTWRYPFVAADYSAFTGYPTSVEGIGEYLVFLRRESVAGIVMWVTTAALAIEYAPDAEGNVVGMLSAGGQDHPAMSRGEVRAFLRRIVAGESIRSEDDRFLHERLSDIALSASLGEREPPTFDERFQQVKALADGIRLGTSRGDVEKVFTRQDGGVTRRNHSRYYAGSEVVVEVPFDEEGGPRNAANRVAGTLRVYRSGPHFD